MNINEIEAFVEPYYAKKDIMHNMWHIELVHKWADKIIKMGGYQIDYESMVYSLYFHGIIYSDEISIKEWLSQIKISKERIAKILKISWESQRTKIPDTLEGKILHDAHILEGGKTYLIVKSLITGSFRGQSLPETLDIIKKQVINKSKCYLPETIPLCEEMNKYVLEFITELEKGIYIS